MSCVTKVCSELKINDYHSTDNWFHEIQAGIRNNEQPVEFIEHCCEIRVQVEESILNYRNMIDPTINKSLRYNVHLYLPELNILFAPSIIDHMDIHGFGKEPTLCLPGLLYGVVGKKCAGKCETLDITPNGSRCKELPTISKELVI